MTFRRKLLAVFALTVFLSVGTVAWLVSAVTRKSFEKVENQRTAALVAQFQNEFDRRGVELVQRVEAIAASDGVMKMGATLNGTPSDSSQYLDLAQSMAEARELDFLELLDERGTIVSSAQWPSKFGYPDTGFENLAGLNEQGAFLKLEELQESTALGLFAVRATRAGDHPVYVVGGRRIDKTFMAALDLPPDMRALLYRNRSDHFSPDSLLQAPTVEHSSSAAYVPDKFQPLIDAVRRSGQEMTSVLGWSSDPADEEVFHAVPLRGAGKDRPLLGVLLIGNSRREYVELSRSIRNAAFLAGGAGIVLAVLLSSWASARVTRRVEDLAHAARDVAAGNWEFERGGAGTRRGRTTRGVVQSYDVGIAGAKGTVGANRTGCGMARAGSTAWRMS